MQSLPLLTRKHASHHNTPSSRVRAMAATRLREAVLKGRVTPEQAKEAMKDGEAGVAKLLLPHLYQCNASLDVPAAPIGNATFIAPEDLANLAPLLKEMHAAGIITPEDMAGANRANSGKMILDLVSLGTKRVVEAAAAKMPTTGFQYVPFHIAPLALERLLSDGHSHDFDCVATRGQVFLATTDVPFVSFADPETTDEMEAICCVIAGLNDKAGTWLIVPPDNVLELIDPMLSELLADVQAHFPKGPISTDMPTNLMEAVAEYYGVDESDSDSVDTAIDRLNDDLRGYIPRRSWHMGDGKVEAFLKAPTGPNATLIRRLFDFYQSLPEPQRFDHREVVENVSMSCDLFIVPSSFWNTYYDTIQSYGCEYEAGELLGIDRSAEITRPHLTALEAAAMATSVATAMSRIIIDESPS